MKTSGRRWSRHEPAMPWNWDAASVRRQWRLLHRGDAEPCPQDVGVLAAWAHFHNGRFHRAAELGLKAWEAGNPAGLTVAHKATAVHANYVERSEALRLDLLLDVARSAEEQVAADPDNISALYWQAYALGRYSQGISVAKALAQGMGKRVMTALDSVIRSRPRHADAHFALGIFHAEVIDKVGVLIARLTYGARKDEGLEHFAEGLRLNPGAIMGRVEYALGLTMFQGDQAEAQAQSLLREAANAEPHDALDELEIAQARAALND